jgi:hypothetical protein
MTTSQSCSWCHAMNVLTPGHPVFCFRCEHRADVCRMACDCPRCRRFESPRDVAGVGIAPGDLVEFLERYHGFSGGKVTAIVRGISGPMAVVEVEPGRVVDVLCRQMRKVTRSVGESG